MKPKTAKTVAITVEYFVFSMCWNEGYIRTIKKEGNISQSNTTPAGA